MSVFMFPKFLERGLPEGGDKVPPLQFRTEGKARHERQGLVVLFPAGKPPASMK